VPYACRFRKAPVIIDPARVCELLIGLGDVTVLGAVDEPGGPVVVQVETRATRLRCGEWGAIWSTEQRPVQLVDLPEFGRRPDWCGTNTGGRARLRRAQPGAIPKWPGGSQRRVW